MELLKNKEWRYWAAAAALLLALIFVIVSAIGSLSSVLNRALNPGLIKAPETVKFNLEKIADLKLGDAE